ncbi:MAG: tRNA lysidine(34) synthetase TilS [Gloeocapsa sp. DLM2.Bin57]|nr:MAG: tRNA lysidine(34) synthetase TilS [Gloeocapsa sp. DLM2.Bin57]
MNSVPWTPLHAKVHQNLRQGQLLPRGAKILVAVSGGQDSVCLLKLLVDLQSHWHWLVAIAHCDHRWSSDLGMSDHVEQLATTFALPFYLKTAVVDLPEKEAPARAWRYQALAEIAVNEGYTHVVTGHTQSDRAETILYNLIRGAGTTGLASLSWSRLLTGNVNLVRPLLNVGRQETYQFCVEFQLPIWEDTVNQDLKFTRNRIRQQLIPYLQNDFNPQVETHLAQTAELLKTETEYLGKITEQVLQEVFVPNQRALNRLLLRRNHLAIQRRVIQEFLRQVLPKSPNFAQIAAVVSLIDAPNRSRTSSFPGGNYLEVNHELIVVRFQEKLDLRFDR